MTGQPTQVRVAVLLLKLAAIGYLVDVGLLIAGANSFPERVRRAAGEAGVDIEQFDSMLWFFALPGMVTALVTGFSAVFLLVMAHLLRSGHNGARITTWVGISFVLICNSDALAVPAFHRLMPFGPGSWNLDQEPVEVQVFVQGFPDGYPSLYPYLSAAIALLTGIALVLGIVLLALPASNAFFRSALRRAELVPQVAGGAQQPPAVPAPRAAGHDAERRSREAELATLSRRHARGELTDDEFEAARQRLSGQGHRG